MKKVSIIIPIYNKEKKIQQIVEAVNHVKFPRRVTLHDLIFVDNGSTDKTFTKITSVAQDFKRLNIAVVSYNRRLAKNDAIREGIKASNTDLNIILSPTLSNLNEKLVELKARTSLRYKIWNFVAQTVNL